MTGYTDIGRRNAEGTVDNSKIYFKLYLMGDFMDAKETSVTKLIVKSLVRYFLLAFLFVFFIFFVNQKLLMWETVSDNKTHIFKVLLLLFYSLPSILAMTIPFAVCIGFVQGFIKIDIGDIISAVGKHGLVKK